MIERAQKSLLIALRPTQSFDIAWTPKSLSASFHGRDPFAPVAALLARGDQPPGQLREARLARKSR
jgi:S-adenosylmethionine hydrolase